MCELQPGGWGGGGGPPLATLQHKHCTCPYPQSSITYHSGCPRPPLLLCCLRARAAPRCTQVRLVTYIGGKPQVGQPVPGLTSSRAFLDTEVDPLGIAKGLLRMQQGEERKVGRCPGVTGDGAALPGARPAVRQLAWGGVMGWQPDCMVWTLGRRACGQRTRNAQPKLLHSSLLTLPHHPES